jgi:hypothetical protein
VFLAPPHIVSNPIYVLAAEYWSCDYIANILIQNIIIIIIIIFCLDVWLAYNLSRS